MTVEVEELTVRYGSLTAVDCASFTAELGSVTVVLGRNGAGKTSTIEVCEGLRKAASGTVRVNGLDPVRQRRELSERVGVMLQDGGVSPSARVLDTVRQYCGLYQRSAAPEELVELVGLQRRSSASWRRLSGGERQRFSLALALAGRPQVVFLDEPTAGVDVDGRELIRSVINGLREDGCTVLLTTHDLAEGQRVADSVVVLDAGRVVTQAPLPELLGGRRSARFRTATPLDLAALSSFLQHQVRHADGTYELLDADAGLVSRLTGVLAELGVEPIDLRVGTDSLEDVFVRLTGQAIS